LWQTNMGNTGRSRKAKRCGRQSVLERLQENGHQDEGWQASRQLRTNQKEKITSC